MLARITALVDHSLLRRRTGADGTARYTMLETIREFGLEQLAASGETDAARAAHASHIRDLIVQAEPALMDREASQRWLGRLDNERGNLRVALTWWLKRGESEAALTTAGALVAYWWFRSDFAEARSWCERALALAVDVAYAESPLSAHYGACVLASNEGNYDRAVAAGETMLHAARVSGDAVGTVRAHYGLCHAARRQGDEERALSHALAAIAEAREAVAREAVSPIWLAWTLSFLGESADIVGNERAESAAGEALSIFRQLGNAWGEANALQVLAISALERGDVRRSVELLAESITLRRAIGERFGAVEGLVATAGIAVRSGRFDDAARFIGAAEAWASDLGFAYHGPPYLHRERTVAALRSTLGDTRFVSARAEGAGMPWTAALTEARRLLEEIAAADPGSIVLCGARSRNQSRERTSPRGSRPTTLVRRAADELDRAGAAGLSGHPCDQPIPDRATATRQRSHVARAGSAPPSLPAPLQSGDRRATIHWHAHGRVSCHQHHRQARGGEPPRGEPLSQSVSVSCSAIVKIVIALVRQDGDEAFPDTRVGPATHRAQRLFAAAQDAPPTFLLDPAAIGVGWRKPLTSRLPLLPPTNRNQSRQQLPMRRPLRTWLLGALAGDTSPRGVTSWSVAVPSSPVGIGAEEQQQPEHHERHDAIDGVERGQVVEEDFDGGERQQPEPEPAQ